MPRTLRTILGGCLVFCLAHLPALALGPVDGEAGFVWWQSDFDRTTDLETVSADAAAPGYRGELWFFNRLGVRATRFGSDLGDLGEDDAEYVSADVMWKLVHPTENNFFAVGLGWQDMQFTESGLGPTLVETSGVRLSLEGRVGLLAMLYLYGQYSYLPWMDDFSPAGSGDVYTDLEGREYELGVSWKIGPFLDMRAGYRESELDFTRQPALSPQYGGTVDSYGYMLGVGVHF